MMSSTLKFFNAPLVFMQHFNQEKKKEMQKIKAVFFKSIITNV